MKAHAASEPELGGESLHGTAQCVFAEDVELRVDATPQHLRECAQQGRLVLDAIETRYVNQPCRARSAAHGLAGRPFAQIEYGAER